MCCPLTHGASPVPAQSVHKVLRIDKGWVGFTLSGVQQNETEIGLSSRCRRDKQVKPGALSISPTTRWQGPTVWDAVPIGPAGRLPGGCEHGLLCGNRRQMDSYLRTSAFSQIRGCFGGPPKASLLPPIAAALQAPSSDEPLCSYMGLPLQSGAGAKGFH